MATALQIPISAIDKFSGVFNQFIANLDGINKSLKEHSKATKTLAEFSDRSGLSKMGDTFKGIGDHIASVGINAAKTALELTGITSLLSVAGFARVAKEASDFAFQIGNISQASGIAVSSLLTLDYIEKIYGMTNGTIARNFMVMQDDIRANLGQFTPLLQALKPQFENFQEIFEDLKGERGADKALTAYLKLLQAIGKYKDPVEQRRFLSILHLTGEQYAQLMKDMTQDDFFAKIQQNVKALGGLNEQEYKTLFFRQQQYKMMSYGFESLGRIFQANIPAITDFNDAIINLLSNTIQNPSLWNPDGVLNQFFKTLTKQIQDLDKWLNQEGGWAKVIKFIDDMAASVKELVGWFNSAVTAVGGTKNALLILAGIVAIDFFAPVIGGAFTLVRALWAITAAASAAGAALVTTETAAVATTAGLSTKLARATPLLTEFLVGPAGALISILGGITVAVAAVVGSAKVFTDEVLPKFNRDMQGNWTGDGKWTGPLAGSREELIEKREKLMKQQSESYAPDQYQHDIDLLNSRIKELPDTPNAQPAPLYHPSSAVMAPKSEVLVKVAFDNMPMGANVETSAWGTNPIQTQTQILGYNRPGAWI